MTATPETLRRAYYVGFVGVVIGCFSPFKVLAYALPAAFSTWMLLTPRNVTSRNRMFAVAAFVCGLGLFYNVVAREFLVSNYVLALITYSSFLPVLLVETKALASRDLLQRMLLLCVGVILFEGIYGTIQAIYGATQTGGFGGANGDYVEGTLHPQLAAEMAGANPMFAINMAMMILACLSMPEVFAGKRRAGLIMGGGALVLASVVHVLIFLVAAAVFGVLWTRPQSAAGPRILRRKVLVPVMIALSLGYVAARRELGHVSSYADSVLDLDALSVPRAIMLYRVFTELPDDAPTQPFVGVGPGQFSSRASLIASGVFLGGPDNPKTVPLFPRQSTYLTREYCLPLIIDFADKADTIGSTQQPFFSLMSIYTELGGAGVLIILWFAAQLLRRARMRVRAHPERRLEATMFSIAVCLFLLLGLQENYWELPQAVLVCLLLLKVLYAQLMYGEAHVPAPTAGQPSFEPPGSGAVPTIPAQLP